MKLLPHLRQSLQSPEMTGQGSWKKSTAVLAQARAIAAVTAAVADHPATPWSRLWGMTHLPSSPATALTSPPKAMADIIAIAHLPGWTTMSMLAA